MRGLNGLLRSLFFWYWATKNGPLCSLFIILVVGNKYLAKTLLPWSFEPWTKRYPGWSSTTTLRDLSCSWQVFLLFVPFLVNRGPSPRSITMYWALSCDVLRHIVTSSTAAYVVVTKSIGFTCLAAESWLVIDGLGFLQSSSTLRRLSKQTSACSRDKGGGGVRRLMKPRFDELDVYCIWSDMHMSLIWRICSYMDQWFRFCRAY
jgi:hypothetical protein